MLQPRKLLSWAMFPRNSIVGSSVMSPEGPASSSHQKPTACEFAAMLFLQMFFGVAVQNAAALQSDLSENGVGLVSIARLFSITTYSSSPSSTKNVCPITL